MFRQAQRHSARVKRPTGRELCEDASRILDELLRRELDDAIGAGHRRQGRHSRAAKDDDASRILDEMLSKELYDAISVGHRKPARCKAADTAVPAPPARKVAMGESDMFGLDDGFARSKAKASPSRIMPSRMKGPSKDDPLKQKELDASRKKAERQQSSDRHEMSLADAERDSASVSENSKKKMILRTAKDRQEGEKEERGKRSSGASPKSSPSKRRSVDELEESDVNVKRRKVSRQGETDIPGEVALCSGFLGEKRNIPRRSSRFPTEGSPGDIPALARMKEGRLKKYATKIEKTSEDEEDDTDIPDGSPCNKSWDIPVPERTKEEMYLKAATKIEKTAELEGGDCKSKADWEKLEQEIVEMLRKIGDEYDNKIVVEPFVVDFAKDFAKDTELYKRFKATMQQALGNEVSWNHLSVLFYTSKGVMTTVGKGTRLASTMKEMTLRYFSDICAGWIIDQGGFDSVLGDSDSELD